MNPTYGYSEKYARTGYLTQASVGLENRPRLRFNPIKTPPNFSPSSNFRSFLKEIEKMPLSGAKPTRYRLLVEQLCDFVEGIDSEGKLGLESRLVKLVEELGLEVKSTRETFNEDSSVALNDLKKLPPGLDSLLSDEKEVSSSMPANMDRQHGTDLISSYPGFENFHPLNKRSILELVPGKGVPLVKSSTMGAFGKDLSRVLGNHSNPQHIPNAHSKILHDIAQPQNFSKPKRSELSNPAGLTSKPNAVPLNQLYSMKFPELKNFRELYKPIVVRYPQPHQVSREKSPFCTIDSAACQLSFRSCWNGLSFAQAEEVWMLGMCIKEWLTHIANNIPDAEVLPGQSESLVWSLYSCPREFLVGILRNIYIRSAGAEPVWAQSKDEIDQFLGTCTAFHTLQTIEDPKGVYAPGFDSYGRTYCMYAMHNTNTVGLRHFIRQIVVPFKQTEIVSGEKVKITPILWDPHKPYDALRKHTNFTMDPPLLNWDDDTKSFTGTINAKPGDISLSIIDCVLRAYTVEDLPKGTSFETKVEASIKFRIRVPNSKKWQRGPETIEADKAAGKAGGLLKADLELGLVGRSDPHGVRKSGITNTRAQRTGDLNPVLASKKGSGLGPAKPTEGHGLPGDRSAVAPSDAAGTHPTFKQRGITGGTEGIVSLRWDPEQWLSVVVRVEDPVGNSGGESRRLFDELLDIKSDENLDREYKLVRFSGYPAYMKDLPRHKYQEETTLTNPMRNPELNQILHRVGPKQANPVLHEGDVDQVEYEGYDLTLGLDIELVLTKSGKNAGYHVFEDIVTAIEHLPSTKVQPIRSKKAGSFGSITFEVDAQMKDKMLGFEGDHQKQAKLANLGIDIEKLRCIQWRKMTIPKILGSLGKYNNQVGDIFTVSMHIGKRDGYTLQEVKRIAKAIVLYGDLFDYTKMMRDEIPAWKLPPDFGSSRHNPYSKRFSASELIDLIANAVSLEDVVKIMNPEMYGVEEYRFNFSELKSQGTITMSQNIPTTCTDWVTRWVASILSTISAAMKAEDSDFVELAKAPGSWKNFELLLANDRENIRQLSAPKEGTQNHSKVCFAQGGDKWPWMFEGFA